MESYQFIKQIGQRSYGESWLVKCSKTRKKYVLKCFDLHRSSKREQRAAYSEAKLLSTLKHPHIVSYLDSFYNSKGNLFVVMSYCECGDFYSFIKNRNGVLFEEKEIINWFVQICMALKYLHDKGILHRDLKTQNIFLTKNKLVKVGDMGIARVLKIAEETATTLFESPYYMSPEIFAGKPYDQKSDVWALGCCMYEIASLERAFVAQDVHTLMQKIVKGKVSPLPSIYSVDLFNIISSMLSPDPDKRPTVTELLLNDFIRKFIILCLRESPIELNSSKLHNSKSTPSLADGVRSTNKLPINEDSNSNVRTCEKVTEEETAIGKIKTIPDSNGNGDGNDNSQHQANMGQHRQSPLSLKISPNCKSTHSSVNSKTNGKEDNISPKTPVLVDIYQNNFKENRSFSQASTPSGSSRSTPTITAEKLRSENSFNLLNNLAYTIKQSRLQNWHGLENGLFPNLPKIKHFYGNSPPKSADELYSTKKDLPKRCALSAQHGIEIEPCEKEGISNHLPQIGNAKISSTISVMDASKISLPGIENSETSNLDNGVKSTTWECITKDDHFDKLLIQNILECNAKRQDNFEKPAMCQHRREILKLNEVSNSTSVI
ncbi:hypothetical protein NPIL_436511 [Nephila pilipes]|uniref:non-specific serine/threonine protein kinase n=1 Tax=Nephila pilipes TaxID=299642 RepID=A0A8X6PTE1_NEPPI|nr:hypothetical protein NPIL_436511 [Nephila pilipes]